MSEYHSIHEAGVPDLGYAIACFGDYAFAESFNHSIRLIRDKTIMQGDSYCNHRYVYGET